MYVPVKKPEEILLMLLKKNSIQYSKNLKLI